MASPRSAPTGQPDEKKDTGTKLRFLPDDPISDANNDRFGLHSAFADTLKKLIDEAFGAADPKGFVIGISGPWGSGKSTIVEILKTLFAPTAAPRTETDASRPGRISDMLNRVRRWAVRFSRKGPQAAPPHTPVVVFDVSQFTDDSLRRWILFELERQLRDAGIRGFSPCFEDSRNFSLLESLERSVQEKKRKPNRDAILVASVSCVLPVLSGVILSHFFPNRALLDSLLVSLIGAVGLLPILTGMVAGIRLLANFTFPAISITSGPTFSPEQFLRLFKEMVNRAVEGGARNLVLCFDNLDRVSGEVALEVLQTIKAFMGQKHCVCLLPCDQDALLAHLTAEFQKQRRSSNQGEPRHMAEEYLQKYFNSVLPMPALLATDISQYAGGMLADAGYGRPAPDGLRVVVATAYGGKTPREVKRFINDLTTCIALVDALVERRDLPVEMSKNRAALAKLLALRARWPDVLEHASKNPRELENLRAISDSTLHVPGYDEELWKFLFATRSIALPDDPDDFWFLRQAITREDLIRVEMREAINEERPELFERLLTNRPGASYVAVLLTTKLIHAQYWQSLLKLFRLLLRLPAHLKSQHIVDSAENIAVTLLRDGRPAADSFTIGHFAGLDQPLADLFRSLRDNRREIPVKWIVEQTGSIPIDGPGQKTLAKLVASDGVLNPPEVNRFCRGLGAAIRQGSTQLTGALAIAKALSGTRKQWQDELSSLAGPLLDVLTGTHPMPSDAVEMFALLEPGAGNDTKNKFAEVLVDCITDKLRGKAAQWAPVCERLTAGAFTPEGQSSLVNAFRIQWPTAGNFPAGEPERIRLLFSILPCFETSQVAEMDHIFDARCKIAKANGRVDLLRSALYGHEGWISQHMPQTAKSVL